MAFQRTCKYSAPGERTVFFESRAIVSLLVTPHPNVYTTFLFARRSRSGPDYQQAVGGVQSGKSYPCIRSLILLGCLCCRSSIRPFTSSLTIWTGSPASEATK